MLVLQRNVGQELVIGEGPNQIRLMVVRTKGKSAWLGVECDESIPVHRREIYERIQKQKKMRGEGCAPSAGGARSEPARDEEPS